MRAFVARPFVILYRVKRSGVQIVRVLHSAQDIAKTFRQP
ncbi:MAG: hypothetical protein HUU20_22210 [Pirellulales bacterium]|nr:hypothetical protein [Pirellulales bacterium]